MKYLDHTLPSPAENLALDEALLDACEAGESEVLRTWEPASPFVVMGYGNQLATEVDQVACAREGVPILRRISGGGTVVQVPGCLCYALILRVNRAPDLGGITETNRYVLRRVTAALASLVSGQISLAGDTDLVLGGRKIAGNSQRRRQRSVLFHGSLLLSADLAQIARLLPMPSREPAYRQRRSHAEFLANLELSPAAVKAQLRHAWDATEPLPSWNQTRLRKLLETQYDNAAWTARA